jgi:hypothetical protein
MKISRYSTIDFTKARNLHTENQKKIKAFNPIVPKGGVISIMEINPKNYQTIEWFFVNEKTGKITQGSAFSADGMHYVTIPEWLRFGTYTLKIVTTRLEGSLIVEETTISNPFEYVEASEDVVTIISRNKNNDLVDN